MKMKKWAALAALLLAVGAATGATAEVAVNDHVFFGHYEQDNDLTNGAEAIEWRVLKAVSYTHLPKGSPLFAP